MFSYLISSISNTLAPERNITLEFHSLLKNGYFDQALSLLRSNPKEIDVHQIGSMGLAPIHFASGAGHLELLAELLSLGVDVCSPSETNNHPLHYACANNCKGVVSLLLRSGADASFPNDNGKIAAELTNDAEIRSMLLVANESKSPVAQHCSVEYTTTFTASPKAQATDSNQDTTSITTTLNTLRIQQSEGDTFHNEQSESHVSLPTATAETVTEQQDSGTVNRSSTSVHVEALNNGELAGLDSENTTISTPAAAFVDISPATIPPPPPILSPDPPRPHDRPKVSPALNNSATAAVHCSSGISESDLNIADADTTSSAHHSIVARTESDGVGSSSLFLPSPSAAHCTDNSQQRKHHAKRRYSLPPGHPSVELPSSPSSAAHRKSSKSKDVLSLNTTPPTSEEKRIGKRRHTVSRYTVAPESPSDVSSSSAPPVIVPLVETPKRPPTGRTPGARRQSSLSTVWNMGGSTSEDMQDDSNISSEENSDRSPRASPRASVVPSLPPPPISPQTSGKQKSPRPYFAESLSGASPSSYYPSYASFLSTQNSSSDVERMHADIVQAAKETAKWFKSDLSEKQLRHDIFKACQQVSNPSLVDGMISKIEMYPHLATCRAANISTFAADGATPLHVAAAWGNLKAIEALLNAPGVSVWTRDLQGRLPLHLAAEMNRPEVCSVLLTAMRIDSQRDLVGEDAPVDLAGLTPMGWAKRKGRPSSDITNLLFKPGDMSILPRTPFRQRTGKSPHKPRSQNNRLTTPRHDVDVTYAYSEAGGWRPTMEDRVITKCPLVPGCCVFAVLDGHGGDFCSEYLETEIPKQIVAELCNVSNVTDESLINMHDLIMTPNVLESVLTTACLEADAALAAVPRMRISTSASTGKLVVYETCGSTGCICMITGECVAVANVGDSRAVVGCWNEQGNCVEALPLSRDHKFTIESERERATNAGCIVSMDTATNTVWEVYNPSLKQDNKLRMSRAFGDFYLKQNKDLPATLQAVTAAPEVIIHERTQRDAFLVVACDGIWDVMTNQEVINFVASELELHDSTQQPSAMDTSVIARVTDSLLEKCIELGSSDNMTAMIIIFNKDIEIMRAVEEVPRQLMVSTPNRGEATEERVDRSPSEDSTSPIRAVKLF